MINWLLFLRSLHLNKISLFLYSECEGNGLEIVDNLGRPLFRISVGRGHGPWTYAHWGHHFITWSLLQFFPPVFLLLERHFCLIYSYLVFFYANSTGVKTRMLKSLLLNFPSVLRVDLTQFGLVEFIGQSITSIMIDKAINYDFIKHDASVVRRYNVILNKLLSCSMFFIITNPPCVFFLFTTTHVTKISKYWKSIK